MRPPYIDYPPVSGWFALAAGAWAAALVFVVTANFGRPWIAAPGVALIGLAVAVVVTTLAYVAWGPAGAAVSAFVAVSVGLTLYERAYNQAARATRTRLAQQ